MRLSHLGRQLKKSRTWYLSECNQKNIPRQILFALYILRCCIDNRASRARSQYILILVTQRNLVNCCQTLCIRSLWSSPCTWREELTETISNLGHNKVIEIETKNKQKKRDPMNLRQWPRRASRGNTWVQTSREMHTGEEQFWISK